MPYTEIFQANDEIHVVILLTFLNPLVYKIKSHSVRDR